MNEKKSKRWSSFDDDRAIEKGAPCRSWVPYPSYQDVKVGDVVRMKNREVDHAFDSCVITRIEDGQRGETIVWLGRSHMRADGLGKQPWLAAEVYNVPMADLVGKFEVHVTGRTEYSSVDNRCAGIAARSIYTYPKGLKAEDAAVHDRTALGLRPDLRLAQINNDLMSISELLDEFFDRYRDNPAPEVYTDAKAAYGNIVRLVRELQQGGA